MFQILNGNHGFQIAVCNMLQNESVFPHTCGFRKLRKCESGALVPTGDMFPLVRHVPGKSAVPLALRGERPKK
jgi:hypothetical protein